MASCIHSKVGIVHYNATAKSSSVTGEKLENIDTQRHLDFQRDQRMNRSNHWPCIHSQYKPLSLLIPQMVRRILWMIAQHTMDGLQHTADFHGLPWNLPFIWCLTPDNSTSILPIWKLWIGARYSMKTRRVVHTHTVTSLQDTFCFICQPCHKDNILLYVKGRVKIHCSKDKRSCRRCWYKTSSSLTLTTLFPNCSQHWLQSLGKSSHIFSTSPNIKTIVSNSCQGWNGMNQIPNHPRGSRNWYSGIQNKWPRKLYSTVRRKCVGTVI